MQANAQSEGMGGMVGGGGEGVWHVAGDRCGVHEEQSPDAHVRFVLPKGSYVTVAEREGNWVRISDPVAGWCSIASSDGKNILCEGDFATVAKFRYCVVCRDGAFVRCGEELTSDLIRTIPQGEIVEVTRKTVNSQGLVRLFVGDGWVSEHLNPLSGQRGPIVELMPMPSPVRYRVVFLDGCVVRSGVELQSACLRTIPCGEELVVSEKAWSESPPLQRLKLTDGSGWVSVKLNKPAPNDVDIVVPVRAAQEQIPTPHRVVAGEDIDQLFVAELPRTRPESRASELPDESVCIVCLEANRNATLVHGGTGHIACCLACARILKARGDPCPVCRIAIERVIQHFVA